jgi:Na+-transporting NADH:ubiquinone oxidoreductase subunit NqrC
MLRSKSSEDNKTELALAKINSMLQKQAKEIRLLKAGIKKREVKEKNFSNTKSRIIESDLMDIETKQNKRKLSEDENDLDGINESREGNKMLKKPKNKCNLTKSFSQTEIRVSDSDSDDCTFRSMESDESYYPNIVNENKESGLFEQTI